MKLIFCIDSLNKGGAERVLSNIVNDFCKDHNITIITTSSTKSSYQIDRRIKIYSLDEEKKHLLKNFVRVKNLYKYIKEIKPDAIITFMPPQSFRVLTIKKLLKTKVIVSVRNDPKKEYSSFKNKIAMKLLYNKADGFVFQTKEAQEYFSKKIQKKSVIIPNPVNDLFLVDTYNGNRKKEIVAVGRLEKQKNYFYLLNTFKELLNIRNDYILKIYGEGSLRNEIEEFIRKNKLEKFIKLMGNKDDIKSEIYKSSVFVLPSLYEGMPNSLMEAMALGLPCISTDCPCGGPKFLIKDGYNGLLVKINDQKELLDAICKYIDDEQFAMKCGCNANKYMKKFSSNNINSLWLNYIKKVKD